jgi:hypothetical protein
MIRITFGAGCVTAPACPRGVFLLHPLELHECSLILNGNRAAHQREQRIAAQQLASRRAPRQLARVRGIAGDKQQHDRDGDDAAAPVVGRGKTGLEADADGTGEREVPGNDSSREGSEQRKNARRNRNEIAARPPVRREQFYELVRDVAAEPHVAREVDGVEHEQGRGHDARDECDDPGGPRPLRAKRAEQKECRQHDARAEQADGNGHVDGDQPPADAERPAEVVDKAGADNRVGRDEKQEPANGGVRCARRRQSEERAGAR